MIIETDRKKISQWLPLQHRITLDTIEKNYLRELVQLHVY